MAGKITKGDREKAIVRLHGELATLEIERRNLNYNISKLEDKRRETEKKITDVMEQLQDMEIIQDGGVYVDDAKGK